MDYISTCLPSAQSKLIDAALNQPSNDHVAFLMSKYNADQDSSYRSREPAEHEQGQHQTADNTLAASEVDYDVSVPEQNVASEATNSTVITTEDLDSITREHEEAVRRTCNRQIGHHSSQGTLSFKHLIH